MPTITTIPLNNNVPKKDLPKMGTYRVVIADEICLTCVLPNTEILSLRNGYREIEGINENRDAISHLGRSTKVLKQMELHYSGEIVEITGVGMKPKSLTADHEIWIKEGRGDKKVWKFVGDLTEEDYLIVPKIVINGKPHYLMIDSEIIGTFVADGFVDKLTNQTRSMVIRQNKVDDIVSILSREGITPHVYENSGSNLIEVHNAKLARWLRYNFYDDDDGNKILPVWFLNLPRKEIIKFIRGYLHDGYLSKKQGIMGFSSKSEKLINQVSFLLLRLGVYPKVTYEEESKEYKGYSWTSKMFRIRLSVKHSKILAGILNIPYPQRRTRPMKKWQVIDTKRYFYIPIKTLNRRMYNGIVKNIQTKSETFALPFIVHNCGHRKRMQWVERVDGKRVLKEVCLFCVTKIHTKTNREGI